MLYKVTLHLNTSLKVAFFFSWNYKLQSTDGNQPQCPLATACRHYSYEGFENVTMKCICCDTESHIIHSGWHLSMNDEDHIIHATHPSWNHAFTKMNRSGNSIFSVLFFVFRSHTFVVWVNSLRTFFSEPPT